MSVLIEEKKKQEASIFAALGDEIRLSLVEQLCVKGPQSIRQLGAASTITRQAITKHLEVLANAGLVSDMKRGRERIWTLSPTKIDEARDYLGNISHWWDDALERLRTIVESDDSSV